MHSTRIRPVYDNAPTRLRQCSDPGGGSDSALFAEVIDVSYACSSLSKVPKTLTALMIKLARRWSKSPRQDPDGKFFIPTRDDFQPMDTREQEEMVRSFETQHSGQNFLWRAIFTVLILSFALFLIFSIFSQALSPWELRYHAYFMDEMESWVVISADMVAVLVCLMALKGFVIQRSRSHKQWMEYASYFGLLLSVFWLYHMFRLPRFRWDAIWLPLGPLSFAGICLYVDRLLAESLEEVRKLRGYMYTYKSS